MCRASNIIESLRVHLMMSNGIVTSFGYAPTEMVCFIILCTGLSVIVQNVSIFISTFSGHIHERQGSISVPCSAIRRWPNTRVSITVLSVRPYPFCDFIFIQLSVEEAITRCKTRLHMMIE